MNKKIQQLRIKIDGLAQLVQSLTRPSISIQQEDLNLENSWMKYLEQQSPILIDSNKCDITYFEPHFPNLYEAHKSLIMAKTWIGTNIYLTDEACNLKKDVANIDEYLLPDCSYEHKLKRIIEEIKEISNTIELKIPLSEFLGLKVFSHLREARFYINFELQRIKDQSK